MLQDQMKSLLALFDNTEVEQRQNPRQLTESIDSGEDAVRVRGGQRFLFPEDGKFGYATDGDAGQFTILDQETGEVRDIPLDKLPDNPLQADLEHLVDEYDDEQFTSGKSVPDWIKKSSGLWKEDAAPVKYGVFSTGGSVGSQRFKDDPIKTFDSKEAAKEFARERRKGLSPGERGYYRMSYVVKPIKGVTEASRGFRGVGGAREREDDERHDLDRTDWYIVKDGKLLKALIYPSQEAQAREEGFSPTREEARAKASNKGVTESGSVNKKNDHDDATAWAQRNSKTSCPKCGHGNSYRTGHGKLEQVKCSRCGTVHAGRNTGVTEDFEVDVDRSDDDMAKNQIHTIKRAAEALEHIIDNDAELPQWIHSKITIAKDYLDTVHEYLASEGERDVEQATGEEEVEVNLAEGVEEKSLQKTIDFAAKRGFQIKTSPKRTRATFVNNKLNFTIKAILYRQNGELWVNWVMNGGMSGNDPIDEFYYEFVEAYKEAVNDAREQGKYDKWVASGAQEPFSESDNKSLDLAECRKFLNKRVITG